MNKTSRIVVTALTIAGTVACGGGEQTAGNPPEPEVVHRTENPPPPQKKPPVTAKRPAPDEPLEHEPLAAGEAGNFGKVLNERHFKLGMIFASADGGCHVYPADGETRPPGMRPPSQTIECPPFMLKPEWGHCTGDAMVKADDMSENCACMPNGNPPPPGFAMPCPEEDS